MVKLFFGLLALGAIFVGCPSQKQKQEQIQRKPKGFDDLITGKVASEEFIKFDREKMTIFAQDIRDQMQKQSVKESNFAEGYWRRKPNVKDGDYPWPVAHDSAFEGKERFLTKLDELQSIASTEGDTAYLKNGAILRRVETLGYVPCFLGDLKNNGGGDYYISFDSHAIYWPTGYRHYVAAHNVIPSRQFYRLIMNLDVTVVSRQVR